MDAIDASHIRISLYSRLNSLNYKRLFPISMQAICVKDSLMFLVFFHCTRSRSHLTMGYILQGDSGYPCLDTPNCLITRRPLMDTMGWFSYCNSSVRSIILSLTSLTQFPVSPWQIMRALEMLHPALVLNICKPH